MLARMNGGSEANVDAGFKIFKDEINANVLAYEPSPGKMTELFQSGQACWPSGARAVCKASPTPAFPSTSSIPRKGRPRC